MRPWFLKVVMFIPLSLVLLSGMQVHPGSRYFVKAQFGSGQEPYLARLPLTFGGMTAEQIPQSGMRLVWSDEFDGPNGTAPDPSKWNYIVGPGSIYGNGELEYYTDNLANAFQQDGKLFIRAIKEPFKGKEYTAARLFTKNKGDWKFGRFEVRAQLPEGQGFWPVIWLMPTENVYGKWPYSGEIDIMENLGQEPSTIYGTAHWADPVGKDFWDGEKYTLQGSPSFSEGFHTYALEWGADVLKWYVDGNLYHMVKHEEPFDQNFYIILNVAVGGKWPGNPNENTVFPQAMLVDYVRVYQLPDNDIITR